MLALLAGTMVFTCGLILASPKERPLKSSCKECRRFCKCECSKGCKCKPGCCRRGESPILDPAFEPFGGDTRRRPKPRPSQIYGPSTEKTPFLRNPIQMIQLRYLIGPNGPNQRQWDRLSEAAQRQADRYK